MYSLIIDSKIMYKISPDNPNLKIDITNFDDSSTTTTNSENIDVNSNNNNNNNNNIIINSPNSSGIVKSNKIKRIIYPSSIIIDGVVQPPGTDLTIIGASKVLSSSPNGKLPISKTTKTTTTTTTTTTLSSSGDIPNSPTSSLLNNINKSNITTDTEIDCIPFFSGNTNIEVTEGLIHLFLNSMLVDPKQTQMSLCQLPTSRTNLICIESVPSYVSIPDLIHFISTSIDDITDVKIIRDASPNRYMVLLRFRDQESSDEFYQFFNGKAFSSFEPETCVCLFVSKVEYQSAANNNSHYFIGEQCTTLPLPPGLVELPTCPVCLERLDSSTTGIVTVLCHHSFHCDCLAKWKGVNSCPVCRFVQVPVVESNTQCSQCDSRDSLWVCIICGHVGCSRYLNSHANKHYQETMHIYALELETQRVWDYAGDGYVHRLIQNRADGKVLEFPGPNPSSDVRDGSHLKEEKIESIVMEYNFLLANQLEHQRAYFEQQMLRMEKETQSKLNQLKEENEKLAQKLTQKFTKVKHKNEDMERENQFLRQINAAIKDNQDKLKKNDEEKDKLITELSEELRDLRFFIEAQKTLSGNEETENGSIIIPTPSKSKKPSSKKR
ncbi:putative RING finger protein [Tieghemostelium lacteum]|uniref:Putative RING finger protein n=1 Tax=Tieghemostelium lacteum TaxID=361077 RepID=A0A152A3Q4_TIELA|nr:putative RING finger protein [Tieghemostelium lacteum]|eukprot:KYR00839.1 putative RING finger protein [Tieghemostelium lacteum]